MRVCMAVVLIFIVPFGLVMAYTVADWWHARYDRLHIAPLQYIEPPSSGLVLLNCSLVRLTRTSVRNTWPILPRGVQLLQTTDIGR